MRMPNMETATGRGNRSLEVPTCCFQASNLRVAQLVAWKQQPPLKKGAASFQGSNPFQAGFQGAGSGGVHGR